MKTFRDKIAIVTGSASGIGRAIASELSRDGARVVVADIDGEAARRVAAELGPGASAAEVDVTDAGAVQRVVDDAVAKHGRLDLMLNNAGIAVFGDARDMTLNDWNRVIDVNLRGVVHGVAAAYPVMVRQRAGHIVNTGSLAGLVPSPAGVGYAMSKHAVVGLSTSLRAEAARYGVRVSVVCPGFVDTPIVEAATVLGGGDRAKLRREFPFRLHPPEVVARAVRRGVLANRAIIPVTVEARIAWWFYRLAPAATTRLLAASVGRNPLLARRPGA